MTEHNVYTLAGMLQNTSGLQQDLSEMLSTLRETLEKDYLRKIRSAADSEKALALEHPPKEVTLLRALSAFTDERGRQQIDRMTQGLLFLHTLQHVQQSVEGFPKNGTLLAARSAGGATDAEVPSAQSARMAGLLLALALADRF